MNFEVTIATDAGTRRASVEANSWFEALARGLGRLGETLERDRLSVVLGEDGLSADIDEPASGRRIRLRPEPPSRVAARKTARSSGPSLDETQPIPLVQRKAPRPQPPSEPIRYVPGSTMTLLTDAFMMMADLLGAFGDDADRALGEVLAFLRRTFLASGGAFLEQDINDPKGRLVVRAAFGEGAGDLLGKTVDLGRGAIGEAARQAKPVRAEGDAALAQPFGAAGLAPRALLAVPVEGEEWLEGLLVLYSLEPVVPFSASQEAIVAQVARSLGSYLSAVRVVPDPDDPRAEGDRAGEA